MPQLDPAHPLTKLLNRDQRYKFDAYAFVFEALQFAHEKLGFGQEKPAEAEEDPPPPRRGGTRKAEKHLTPQQLCEAVRQYALEQFGLMAKPVLASWGIHSTGDIGNLVFNLIEIGQMKKTKEDTREDFDDVYDFDSAFVRDFKITSPPAKAD